MWKGALNCPLLLYGDRMDKIMLEKKSVSEIVEKYLDDRADRGLYLVNVEIDSNSVLTVEIDKDSGVSLDDCIELNKYLSSILDGTGENYELDVCSAGLSSPFKILRQYQKNIGKEVESLTESGLKINGILKAADEDGIVVTVRKKIKPEGAKRKKEVEEDLHFLYKELKYTKYSIRFK